MTDVTFRTTSSVSIDNRPEMTGFFLVFNRDRLKLGKGSPETRQLLARRYRVV